MDHTPIYANSRYDIHIGIPEITRDRPDPRQEYLIYNRETGVQEYSHSVLIIAKDWADNFAKLMDEPKIVKEEVNAQTELFN